jgi:hypothetical protein
VCDEEGVQPNRSWPAWILLALAGFLPTGCHRSKTATAALLVEPSVTNAGRVTFAVMASDPQVWKLFNAAHDPGLAHQVLFVQRVAEAGETNVEPLDGAYEVDGHWLRFKPADLLVPGETYEARLDLRPLGMNRERRAVITEHYRVPAATSRR